MPSKAIRTIGVFMFLCASIAAAQTAPVVNSSGGILNGASFSGLPPAAGSIVSLFGTNLGSFTLIAVAPPLPTTFGGVTVGMDSTAAPLFFASPAQINLQIPWELVGQAQVSVTVSVGSITSAPVALNLTSFAPGIFTVNSQGNGQGAILISSTGELAALEGSLPGRATRPVRSGEFLSIYCTGLGDVTNRPASGLPAPGDPLSTTIAAPTVTIGGVSAAVNFSGLSPGFVGVYQVDVQVPENVPTGAEVPVELTIGGAASNTVTIAVGPLPLGQE